VENRPQDRLLYPWAQNLTGLWLNW